MGLARGLRFGPVAASREVAACRLAGGKIHTLEGRLQPMRLLSAGLLGLLLAGAGCLSSSPAPDAQPTEQVFEPFVPPAPDFDFSTVVDPDHGAHEVAELHTAGHGLDLV